MKSKLGRLAAAVGIVIAVFVIAVVTITLLFGRNDRICKGVSISGVDVGRMPRAEAERVIRQWATARAHRDVTLTALDRRWHGPLASLGLRVDWQDAADRAFVVGRQGSIIHRAICVLTYGGEGKRIVARSLFDPRRLGRTLKKVARTVNRPHQDARMMVAGGRLQIRQDTCGIKLDKAAAAEVITSAAGSGQNVMPLPVMTDPPKITARDCAGINTLLSSFTTPFNRGKRGRTHNLTLAARTFDGAVLKPAQVFSVNDTVGPRLEGRGYRMAQVFIKGELVDGIGGGVCQVSSTLFNAVLLAGLKVLQRSPHSETVPYVSPGRDATVAFGQRDFKFRNSATMPIAIVSSVTASHLTIQIYGSAIDKKEVKVYTGKLVRLGAGSTTVVDSTLPEGTKRVVDKGARGAVVVLYRKIVGADGNDIVESFRSRYTPHKAVIAIGPASVE